MRVSDFSHESVVARRPHHVAPVLASVRLIFVIDTASHPLPGSSGTGLSVTPMCTMRVLRQHGVHCEGWYVKSPDELFAKLEADRWTAKRPVTHVVINTPVFIQPQGFAELGSLYPEIHFVQLNHSGLAYLSIDHYGMKNIREVLDLELTLGNVHVAGNNRRFTRWTETSFGQPSLYLPNLFDTSTFTTLGANRCDQDPLKIGSFGSGRPWKNQLVAAEAALEIGRELGVKVQLYINEYRGDADARMHQARYELFEGLPMAELVPVPFAHWAKFRRTIAAMDLLLSPSFDETFCMIAADGIAEGVPSVVSEAMQWCPPSWMSHKPFDPADVAAVAMGLLHNRTGAVREGRVALSEYVRTGIPAWIDYLIA